MRNKIISAGLIVVAACLLISSQVKADALTAYQLMLLSAAATPPEYKAALANQANQNAAAANQNAINTQNQANQAMLLAIAASQDAYAKQAQANLAAVNAAAANQYALNTIIMNNPVLLAVALKPKKPVDPKVRNLELLHNINTIDQARIAAVNARATANTTLARLNDMKPILEATKVEVKYSPGLTQRLNELTVMVSALEAQYSQQNADANAKEETLRRLQATLPTAGYNPALCDCYY
ncbi:MAG: hypothetical protein IKP31_00445 [Lachnospiraceae bacterium]|nr:hypothetical protein [Lachnospiraceae bacterium]